MSAPELLPGLSSAVLATPRLKTHVLSSAGDGPAVVFIHGNLSSSRFFEETLAALPTRYRGIAPDFRSFGRSEAKPIDATRGLRDLSDDLRALLTLPELGLGGRRVHLVGWSTGGGVVMQYAIDHPADVASVVLVAPVSPYGFGATKDAAGAPCWDDFAGSGGGIANPEFVKRLAARDAGDESDFSPRRVMNQFYFKPPFRVPPAREDLFVSEILLTRLGDEAYPGDSVPSPNWPGVAPGARGIANAFSPRYHDASRFSEIDPRPDVLWIRGADDAVVSDGSLFELGMLGKLGAMPGWPGEDVFPPQPMIAQTRAVLDAYRARGGRYREEVLESVGHSPHIEEPQVFLQLLVSFLEGAR